MRQTVRDNYAAFTSRFEGAVPWMYLDVLGKLTTGIGNLIDSPADAQRLPWRHGLDGPHATPAEIAAAWQAVHARQDLKKIGGGQKIWGTLTDLRLDADGIRQLVDGKLQANEAILRTRFPGYDSWPSDAQLGLLSMAWAMGPNFKFPKFEAAVNQLVPDFRTAAGLSHMNTAGNPGLVPRNTANDSLFTSAADALAQNLDLDQIHWSGFDDLLAKGTAALASGLKSGAAVAREAVSVGRKRSGWLLGGAVLVAAGSTYAAYRSGLFESRPVGAHTP